MCVCGDAVEQWQASETAEGATTTQASHPSIHPLVAAMPGIGSSQFTHSTDPAPTWQRLSSETRAHSHTTCTCPRPHAHKHTHAHIREFEDTHIQILCAHACGRARNRMCERATVACMLRLHERWETLPHIVNLPHVPEYIQYIRTHNHESLPAGSMAACIVLRAM